MLAAVDITGVRLETERLISATRSETRYDAVENSMNYILYNKR